MNITRNRKNSNLAMPADAAATPPNPNIAAIMAIIKNVTAQPNMFHLLLKKESNQLITMRVRSLEIGAKTEKHPRYARQRNQRNEIEITTQTCANHSGLKEKRRASPPAAR
jgi:hypothetical protein